MCKIWLLHEGANLAFGCGTIKCVRSVWKRKKLRNKHDVYKHIPLQITYGSNHSHETKENKLRDIFMLFLFESPVLFLKLDTL